jgi:putative cardiolipin synthase
MRNSWVGGLAASCILVLTGCVGLPQHVQRIPSEALHHPDTTTLGRIVEHAERDRNLSGIRLLSSGDEALASLIALADHAERTLDIQYYIIHQDDSARLLLHHVRLAADRGVRVRLLVDDLNTAGEDRRFMHLGQHANVEVRCSILSPAADSATCGPLSPHRCRKYRASITACTTSCSSPTMPWPSPAAATSAINISRATRKAISSISTWWRRAHRAGTVRLLRCLLEQQVRLPDRLRGFPGCRRRAAALAGEGVISGEAGWLGRELDARDLRLDWVPATVLADRPAKIASDARPTKRSRSPTHSALMRSAKSGSHRDIARISSRGRRAWL